MVALAVNYLAAFVLFIFYSFIKPPKMPSPDVGCTITDIPVITDHTRNRNGSGNLVDRADGQQDRKGGIFGAIKGIFGTVTGAVCRFWASIKEEQDFRLVLMKVRETV